MRRSSRFVAVVWIVFGVVAFCTYAIPDWEQSGIWARVDKWTAGAAAIYLMIFWLPGIALLCKRDSGWWGVMLGLAITMAFVIARVASAPGSYAVRGSVVLSFLVSCIGMLLVDRPGHWRRARQKQEETPVTC